LILNKGFFEGLPLLESDDCQRSYEALTNQ